MKACFNCGAISDTEHCVDCGAPMGEILFRSEDDIFVRIPESLRHAFGHTGIMSFGKHIGCNGLIHDKQVTSSGKPVLTCAACCLRVVLNTT